MKRAMDDRHGTYGVLFARIAVTLTLFGLLAYSLSQQLHIERLSSALTTACMAANASNDATRVDLAKRIELYNELVKVEQSNVSAEAGMRSQRIAAYLNARSGAEFRLANVPSSEDCIVRYS